MTREEARLYSPETLAEHWDCSVSHIKKMLRSGALRGFKIGTMWRIAAAEVERFECQGEGPKDASLPVTAAATASSGTPTGDDNAARLARMMPHSPGPVLVSSSPPANATPDRTGRR